MRRQPLAPRRCRPCPASRPHSEQALTVVTASCSSSAEASGRSAVASGLWDTHRRSRRSAREGAPSVGLWEAIGAVSRLLHAGCNAGDLQVNAFNGRLFAPASAPLADRRDLDDEAARRALVSITTRGAVDGAGQERISYRDLGVEQLGAVYETLLDYTPVLDDPPRGRKAPVVSLRTGSGLRKASGTFYTPQPLTRFLVRHTLDPLVREALPEEILRLRVLDRQWAAVCFRRCLLASGAGAESALVRTEAPGTSRPARTRRYRRTIAERCLFGVDINPMAATARLSLWLATRPIGRQLSRSHLQTETVWLGRGWALCDAHPQSGAAGRQRTCRFLPAMRQSAT